MRVVLIGYGLYLQHVEGLMPCPLCILQRLAFIGVGIVALIAALHNPPRGGRKIYAALLLVLALSGFGVAARHVWVQNLPPEQLATCGPGMDYMVETFGLAKTLPMIFKGEAAQSASAEAVRSLAAICPN